MEVPIDTFIERIKATIVWRKLLRRRVLPQVKVARTEVQDAVQKAEDAGGKEFVRIAEIFVPFEDENTRSKAIEKAKELKEKAKTTNAFMQLAKLHSRAPTATVGGDLGEIEANVLDKDIRIVASKLSPGTTSDPFEFSDGIYIIHLISRRKLSESMAKQETMTLAQAVARIPKNSSVDDISARLKKTVEDTKDCNAFDAAAKRFSPTQPARIVDVNINDLPEFVRKYVNGMSAGQQTPALSINGGVVILMVCERKMLEPQFQSEETITDSLQLERIERQAETYLRDLRRLALIEINR